MSNQITAVGPDLKEEHRHFSLTSYFSKTDHMHMRFSFVFLFYFLFLFLFFLVLYVLRGQGISSCCVLVYFESCSPVFLDKALKKQLFVSIHFKSQIL